MAEGNMDERERVGLCAQWYALHKAGYAVAAIYLELDVRLVRIGGQAGSAVECLLSGPPPITLRDFAVRIIPSLAAASMTGAYGTGHHGPEGWSMADDMAEADGLLEDMRDRFEPRAHPWDLAALMNAQLAFAEDLLALVAPAVEAVALALLREEQLDGDALLALVAAAQAPARPVARRRRLPRLRTAGPRRARAASASRRPVGEQSRRAVDRYRHARSGR